MVDEEVAIKVFDTGILWILSCSIKILLQRNNVFKRREVLDRMPSSSTANAVPLPRWGRLNTPTNQNLKILGDDNIGVFWGNTFLDTVG